MTTKMKNTKTKKLIISDDMIRNAEHAVKQRVRIHLPSNRDDAPLCSAHRSTPLINLVTSTNLADVTCIACIRKLIHANSSLRSNPALKQHPLYDKFEKYLT